ncbi:MAG: 1-aminocyclopropane-1-carboxylate deaminase/D-cysteine desulfhydrase [Bacteroidetes bacterium]|nr:1-aminocyclopropane-1-carboxylate deaminase/D-cysteine desulfhydrase [Bacteroidota bacterium]
MISISVPLQKIEADFLRSNDVHLFVYRLDQTHPNISGNKLFKLHYNLLKAKEQQKSTILTFGGAFSNHIAATAAAGKEQQFNTIGIIRGEKYPELNQTLVFAQSCGMELHYVTRELYKDKERLDEFVKNKFAERNIYMIPEGGANDLGVKGCKEITANIPGDFDIICCPCGTGTTLAGIILSLKKHQHAIGFQVLKADNYIYNEVQHWLKENKSDQTNWSINEQNHFGGYAKVKAELMEFMKQFKNDTGIPLDQIYTGKMMFGIYDMIRKGELKKGSKVIALHTGGLQGNPANL